jgi:tetratricopeptide (TPR) repeat protein
MIFESRSRSNIALMERRAMNYPANNSAVFRRDCARRALTGGALACALAALLSTAVAFPALADPGIAHSARVTLAAKPSAVSRPSARAEQDGRTCAEASGDVAIKACSDAIASGQHHGEVLAQIYYNRAIEYRSKGDDLRALADYSEAIRLYPNDGDYYHNRGNIWLGRKDYVLAIADFGEAIRLAPNDASAYYNRGSAFAHRGENGHALADFNEAIRLAPNDAGAFNNRGLVWGRQGDNERAIADFSEAIRLAPDQAAAAYYNRGRVWYRLKDYPRAVADLDEAARLDPADADTLYARGLARRATGDIAGGEADIAAAKRIDPNVAISENASRQI